MKLLPRLLAPALLCVACGTPTTYEQRLQTVIPVYEGQLEKAAETLEEVKGMIHAEEYSEDASFLLDRMTLAIEGDLRAARLRLVRAGADGDGDALEAIGDSILAIHVETEELRSMVDQLNSRE